MEGEILLRHENEGYAMSVTATDITEYLKDRAMFVLSTLEFAVVGGIGGSVVGYFMGYLSQIPFVGNPLATLGALGATAGFFVPFAKRALKSS